MHLQVLRIAEEIRFEFEKDQNEQNFVNGQAESMSIYFEICGEVLESKIGADSAEDKGVQESEPLAWWKCNAVEGLEMGFGKEANENISDMKKTLTVKEEKKMESNIAPDVQKEKEPLPEEVTDR